MASSQHQGLMVFLLLASMARGVMAADVSPSMLKIERFNAERGDANSQYFMGEHYELGDSGLTQNLEQALEWYRKSAKAGNGAAQYKIGTFYEKGLAQLSGGREKALEWYNTAAASGNEPAVERLAAIQREKELLLQAQRQAEEARRREAEQRRQSARNKMLRANKPAMAGLPLSATAAVSSPAELRQRLLERQWGYAGKAAEYLPSEDMSCLQNSDTEITCFSHERQRQLESSRLLFTVKSVLTGFDKEGNFSANYYYNVTDMEKVKGGVAQSETFGLRLKEGWQQPGITAQCKMEKLDRVACQGTGHQRIVYEAR